MRFFHSKWSRTVALIALPLLCIVISLFSGRFFLSPAEVLSTLLHPVPGAAATTVVFQLRLPRSVAAAFVGASLSASGAAYQGVFRNPLVNSSLLGVSQGAGFGAALYPCAFLFAVLAVVLSILSGRICNTNTNVTLSLGGVIVSSFFSALTSILKYMADPYSQLPAITFWFMGSFASVGTTHLVAILPMLLGLALIYLCRWKINILSMGDREAAALGLNLGFYKLLLIGGATLCTTAALFARETIRYLGPPEEIITPDTIRAVYGVCAHISRQSDGHGGMSRRIFLSHTI